MTGVRGPAHDPRTRSPKGRKPISRTDELTSRQIAFFSQTTLDGAAVQAALSRARVVLIGGGAVAEGTADALAAAGMKPASHSAQFSADDTRGASCVLVCEDWSAPAVLSAVNSAALNHGWPWIPGRIEYGIGMIGPTVIPGQTACYRCFEMRRQANLPRPTELQGQTPIPANEAAAPGPMAAAIGSLLVLEAMRLICRVALPQTIGTVLTLDFFATGITSHRVLRLPNCPDCGYGRRRLPEIPAKGM
jgi:bacteriocin biosynthesis cyclodehydratase domain-containing protein